MNDDAYNAIEPGPEELGRLRATLDAHAEEIALAAAALPEGAIVYAVVERDGRWSGTMAAHVHEGAGPYLAGTQGLAFVVPARYKTPEAVRALVAEHLGPAGEE